MQGKASRSVLLPFCVLLKDFAVGFIQSIHPFLLSFAQWSMVNPWVQVIGDIQAGVKLLDHERFQPLDRISSVGVELIGAKLLAIIQGP